MSNITIDNISGSKIITHRTPIIVLRDVPLSYLIPIKTKKSIVYEVNTRRLIRDLERRLKFIYQFIPVGQINGSNKKTYTVLMANRDIFQTANNYEMIIDNIWIGKTNNGNGQISTTLGVIYKEKESKELNQYPVFPQSFMFRIKQSNQNKSSVSLEDDMYGSVDGMTNDESDIEIYQDLYTNSTRGSWGLIKNKFDVDGKHLKMVDPSGNMRELYIPRYVRPNDVISGYDGNSDDYDKKVFFNAQGEITSDSNCVPPSENMNKMYIDECNGTKTKIAGSANPYNIIAHDSSDIMFRFTDADNQKSNVKNKNKYQDKKILKHGGKLVLREKDEPWFTDREIVGDVANHIDAHKITGLSDSSFDDADSMKYISTCKTQNPKAGYSRYQKMKNCKETFVGSEEEVVNNTNNIILYGLCLLLIILLIYKKM